MSKLLADAIDNLRDVAAAQLEEMRDSAAARRHARLHTPEFAAELAARARPLRHVSFASALVTPSLAVPFERTIPGSFWSQVDDGTAEVACPCKATPNLPLAIPQPCECERVYLYTGTEVRVARLDEAGDIAVVD